VFPALILRDTREFLGVVGGENKNERAEAAGGEQQSRWRDEKLYRGFPTLDHPEPLFRRCSLPRSHSTDLPVKGFTFLPTNKQLERRVAFVVAIYYGLVTVHPRVRQGLRSQRQPCTSNHTSLRELLPPQVSLKCGLRQLIRQVECLRTWQTM
jgi:hypothetical protein